MLLKTLLCVGFMKSSTLGEGLSGPGLCPVELDIKSYLL